MAEAEDPRAAALRRFFEIDANHITHAAIAALGREGAVELPLVHRAQQELEVDLADPRTLLAARTPSLASRRGPARARYGLEQMRLAGGRAKGGNWLPRKPRSIAAELGVRFVRFPSSSSRTSSW